MDTPAPKYPLEQLVLIKKNRFDQAVKILEEKKELLAKAHEALHKVAMERDKVLQHKQDKLTQLRDALDTGTTSDKVQQMKVYLKIVDERLVAAERKVTDAKGKVDLAQKQVDAATQEVFLRKKDVEKLDMHKVEWKKRRNTLWCKKRPPNTTSKAHLLTQRVNEPKRSGKKRPRELGRLKVLPQF